MKQHTTFKELETAHLKAERDLLERTLKATGWSVAPAARRLQITEPRMRRLIAKHPKLAAQQAKKGPGRGRPHTKK